MPKNILLTGTPGSGKTTVVREILAQLDRPADGFYTAEIRAAAGREGFRLVTLDGREAVLAHLRLLGRARVGRYTVDTAVLNDLAVDSLGRAIDAGHLVVIDEIGPMELVSRAFRRAVIRALDSRVPVLATIFRGRHPFADAVKERADVVLLDVRRDNQDQIVTRVLAWLAEVSAA